MIYDSIYFGLVISVLAFQVGRIINKKVDAPYTNPLLIGGLLAMGIVLLFKIPVQSFAKGGDLLEMLIVPATVCLALPIFDNLDTVKKNIIPILAGTAVGSVSSVVLVYALSKLFGLDDSILMSLVPKSVTTPIAIEISAQNGGIEGITTMAVTITGIFGAIIAPYFVKIFKTTPIESGLAIGTASHVAGTSKAVKLGELEGALSGIAIGFAGVFTVIWSIFL